MNPQTDDRVFLTLRLDAIEKNRYFWVVDDAANGISGMGVVATVEEHTGAASTATSFESPAALSLGNSTPEWRRLIVAAVLRATEGLANLRPTLPPEYR